MPNIPAPELTAYIEAILRGAGVPQHKAAIAAEALVAANLRGVDSHGVHLIPYYVEQLLAGGVDPLANGRIVSEDGCSMTFDGEGSIGHWVAETCCGHAIRLARTHGIGMVVARESHHFGAAAFWAQKISAAGQIGIVMCNASAIVPPWQGKAGRVGTNPICMALPGPWLLDMATTTVAANKIFKAFLNGDPEIPGGWAFDAEGVPTTNTDKAYHGMLMPLGGYKGSGLGMMVEILCGVLSGGAMSTEVGGTRSKGKRPRNSQMYLAIDIARFMPVEEFTERVEKLVWMVKSAPPAPGYDEVLVAGDPEWRIQADRLNTGIPIPNSTWEELRKAAAQVGVPAPAMAEGR